MSYRPDFLIRMVPSSKRQCCFLNFHVQFSCGSYSGQGTSTTCSIASAQGTCDLEPIQDMLIFRTKSTALLVLAASPRQSYQSWEEEIKGKGTSQVSPVRSEAFQHCSTVTHFILANLSLARSYFCHGISSRSSQSNWVLWHLCDIFGFLWVIGMDEVRKENLQFT